MTIFRVGVDIGGTFTDIVFLGDGGERFTKKVSSPSPTTRRRLSMECWR